MNALQQQAKMIRILSIDQETEEETENGDMALDEFLAINADGLCDDDAKILNDMEAGEFHFIGGGAAELFRITRLS